MDVTKQIATKQNAVALPFGRDIFTEAIRLQVRGAISRIFDEELHEALGAAPHQRTPDRRGYRHGSESREVTTPLGKTVYVRPRGKLFGKDGELEEWQSSMLPRYARRATTIDASVLGMYLGGVNTRKVQQAIRPLLKNCPLSKSAVSRVIVRLKEYFEKWRNQSLAEERIAYIYLDGICVRVRCAKRTENLPVLAAVGVRANGEKVLLALELRGGESEAAWKSVLESLSARGLRAPRLAIVDGSPGLAKALDAIWPKADRQRCAVHKLRNLLAHAPKRLYEEIRTDFHNVVYAEDTACAHAAYEAFIRKWRRLHEGVARSMEEAGMELLTFYRYPQTQWKSLRTTNVIERLNGEFRRRIKTQGSFPSEAAVSVLLFGLVASGMIRLHRIAGYEDIEKEEPEAKGLRVPETSTQTQLIAVAA